MWTTILVLALALNFEPLRIGLVPVLLSREHPTRQLAAYLAATTTVALAFGLFTVTTANHALVAHSGVGAAVQIGVGVLAVLIAAGMAIRRALARAPATAEIDRPALEPTPPSRAEKHLDKVRRLLDRGQSPWVAGMVGASLGLPSVDYLAMLAVIATSGKGLPEKYAGVAVFLVLGSLVVWIPLIGCLLAPEKTLDRAQRFRTWATSRSVYEYAAALCLAGLLMIGLGVKNLLL
jgi:hypothetical protein